MNDNHTTNWSLVIPTYNGQKLLHKHLPEIIKLLEAGDELIIVDDASTDDTVTWLESFSDTVTKRNARLKIVQHRINQRFAAAVNSGVLAASHELIFLLNNDVTPLTDNTKQRLLKKFESDQNLFAVGCAEVQENTEDAPVYGRGTGGFQRGLLMHWYDPDQSHATTLWVAGGSMCFSKTKYLHLGGMDTLFQPAYEEDRDLSYRAVKHGWNIEFAPNIRVWHQHESTNATVFGHRQMAINSWKNQLILVWKNITDPKMLAQHVLWLPFHLTVTNYQSNGTFGVGMMRALRQLPAVIQRRWQVRQLWNRSDQDVLIQAAQG